MTCAHRYYLIYIFYNIDHSIIIMMWKYNEQKHAVISFNWYQHLLLDWRRALLHFLFYCIALHVSTEHWTTNIERKWMNHHSIWNIWESTIWMDKLTKVYWLPYFMSLKKYNIKFGESYSSFHDYDAVIYSKYIFDHKLTTYQRMEDIRCYCKHRYDIIVYSFDYFWA